MRSRSPGFELRVTVTATARGAGHIDGGREHELHTRGGAAHHLRPTCQVPLPPARVVEAHRGRRVAAA